jgi:KUP system potassium uptake protein
MSNDENGSGTAATTGQPRGRYLAALCVGSLGVVFGDIGTSPLYALRECFHGAHGIPVTSENVLGVLSLVFWSLTIVISFKYLAYVMRADNRGEGGVLALMALAAREVPNRRRARFAVLTLGLFGAALLYGDGMITPAISVLGAMEGLTVAAPSLGHFVVPVTICILVGLFVFQRRGTAGVGAVFGPVTLVWFLVLSVLGLVQIVANPAVLAGVNPIHGVWFLLHNRLHGFLVLGAVFLVVTGGEALYADLGHFGTRPIRLTWFAVVLPSLLLNYFGQGALLLARPAAASNPFYQMAPSWALVPLLILATCATVIASQAVISGAFSLTRQATMLGFWPRLDIQHTSSREIGQIYVPAVNWILMLATIGLVLGFGSSTNLAAAYGIAVSTTMVITSLLAYLVARHRWGWNPLACIGLTAALLVVDTAFFAANVVKIEDGGWFPLAVAAAVFLLMTTWKKGRALLAQRIQRALVPFERLFELMKTEAVVRVPGAAIYMTSSQEGVPPALMTNIQHNHAVHEQVVLLTIVTEEVPRVEDDRRVAAEQLGEGFVRVVARYGFMESPDVVALLAREDTPTPAIEHTTFVLGNETVLVKEHDGMSGWRTRLFSFLARNAVRPTTFFNIPTRRIMEIGSQISL